MTAPFGSQLLPERFWTKIDVDQASGCWLWTASLNEHGYAWYAHDGRSRIAHRVVYRLLVGPIPDGLVIDHLCRVRHCVNPGHMEPVTHKTNSRRGATGRLVTVCRNGHPYTPETTYWKPNGCRNCRICRTEADRRRKARRRVMRMAVGA